MVRTVAMGVAAALTVLLVYTIYLAATSSELVVPSNGVIGRETADNPSGAEAGRERLQARTDLQRWRTASGPSPGQADPAGDTVGTEGNPAPGPGPGPGEDIARQDGRRLVQTWLGRQDGQSGMLQEPRMVEGRTTLPGAVKDVFVQPQGRDWRAAHGGPILFGGAIYLVSVAALLAAFLSVRGRVPLKEGFSGRAVLRFNALERANHWMTAVSFILLGLTGLVIIYGKALIRPWLGPGAFGDLAAGSVWLHMALIVPFTLGLAVMIAMWTLQNLPKRIDLEWLKRGGGFVHDDAENPPAERFNAGQKLIFWAVILGGLALIVSGLALMFPFMWAGYGGMQIAQSIHAIAALVMIGIIFGHIYIGTVGMVGAFDAMWSGMVDRNWAKEHHSLWYRRAFGPDGESRGQPAE